MSKETKPREFQLVFDKNRSLDMIRMLTLDVLPYEKIHVTETRAYLALKEELAQVMKIGVEGQREINRKLSDEFEVTKRKLQKAREIHEDGLMASSLMYKSKLDSDKYVKFYMDIYDSSIKAAE